MSDILGRLAARVLAPERAIRPRMHSVFESFEAEPVIEIAPAVGPVRTESTPQPQRNDRPSPPRSFAALRMTEGAVPRDEVVHERVREVVREEPRIIEAEPQPRVVGRTLPAQTPPEPPPRIETQTVVRERHTVERSERIERSRIDRLRVHRERERSEVARTPPVSTPVEITIGRIDVRAVIGGTVTPPPRQRERPATMSLRDYLARRDERRGR